MKLGTYQRPCPHFYISSHCFNPETSWHALMTGLTVTCLVAYDSLVPHGRAYVYSVLLERSGACDKLNWTVAGHTIEPGILKNASWTGDKSAVVWKSHRCLGAWGPDAKSEAPWRLRWLPQGQVSSQPLTELWIWACTRKFFRTMAGAQ